MRLNGQKIRELRKAAGLSQFELSLECDLSRQAIDLIENNHSINPYLETVLKLADYFKIDDIRELL